MNSRLKRRRVAAPCVSCRCGDGALDAAGVKVTDVVGGSDGWVQIPRVCPPIGYGKDLSHATYEGAHLSISRLKLSHFCP